MWRQWALALAVTTGCLAVGFLTIGRASARPADAACSSPSRSDFYNLQAPSDTSSNDSSSRPTLGVPSAQKSGQQGAPSDDQAGDSSGASPSAAGAQASDSTNAQSSNPSDDSSDDQAGSGDKGPPVVEPAQRKGKLGQQSKLELVRFVDGEFVKAVIPLPRSKDGLKIVAGQPVDGNELSTKLREGTAASKGDTVQITNLEFRDKQIVVQINGGSKQHFHLLEHLQIGTGDNPQTVGSPQAHRGEGGGSILILDYGRPVPDMTTDDFKHDLSVALNFADQHSAAVNWMDTLKPEFKQGIQDHKAVVGMDAEMVIAAIGRPERKVRERDQDGNDTEDWIYGNPPAKTTFVTFSEGKVLRVEEFE